MRITQWGEYGIHCAVTIAQAEKRTSSPVGAEYISKGLNIDLQYTQQILQRLRRKGIIKSIRGPHGGYCLAKSAEQITLHDILAASEGNTLEVICETKPLQRDVCLSGGPCYLRNIWQLLRKHINGFLAGYTLRDLAAEEITTTKVVQLGK